MENHKQGKWQDADDAYKEIIAEEPDNADVMYLLATSQMSQKKLSESLDTIEKAITINDKAPSFFQLKASVLARQGKTNDALESISKALKDNPSLYQGQILAGHLYYEKGNKNKATTHFKMAQKISHTSPEAKVNLAKIMLDDGEVQKAINSLREVEQEHPEQASVKMMMGQAFIESGAYSFAENYFQKVLAMHPDYDLAGLYLGIAKLSSGDLEGAEKLITTFNQQYPNTKEGLAALGLLMFKKNHFRAAIEYLRRAIVGMSPMSWKAAFVESLSRLGQFKQAVEFYENIENKFKDKKAIFRLAELYELQGKPKKAKKQYKKTEENDSKYIASLLGITRCLLVEEKSKEAEKIVRKVLERHENHAEAKLLLLTSLLGQGKEEETIKTLENMDYSKYNDIYKKTFRIQHGLILNKNQNYSKAVEVFSDETKKEQNNTIEKAVLLSEAELKEVQSFKTKIDDDKKDPVFIIGSQSTALNQFVSWLNAQKAIVLNDRLVSLGRPDILYGQREISVLTEVDDDMVRLERKLYHQKAKVLMTAIKEEVLFADCMYINPLQMTLVKKFFPNAKIILLTRDIKDIWLNQKIFGEEPIDSKNWNKAINQIVSMGLNITQIDIDKWLDNDKVTLKELSGVFSQELKKNKEEDQKYWRKTFFEKGHWQNYKEFLGS